MATRQDIIDLAGELQVQYDRLQARQEFLALKEDESMLGGEFAYPALLSAFDEWRNERLMLDAHAAILEGMIKKSRLKPLSWITLLIARIHAPPGVNVY